MTNVLDFPTFCEHGNRNDKHCGPCEAAWIDETERRIGGELTPYLNPGLGFLGMKAFEEPTHPHITRPPGRTGYRVQLELFWSLSENAPHESYQTAWLCSGLEDPMD